jgi:hypothetical protein
VVFSAAIRTSGWAYSSSNVDGGAGGAVSGRGGGALDSTVLNDAAATQGHDHPARSVIASASRPLPAAGSSAYTSRTALLTKRSAVRSTNHLVTKRA